MRRVVYVFPEALAVPPPCWARLIPAPGQTVELTLPSFSLTTWAAEADDEIASYKANSRFVSPHRQEVELGLLEYSVTQEAARQAIAAYLDIDSWEVVFAVPCDDQQDAD